MTLGGFQEDFENGGRFGPHQIALMDRFDINDLQADSPQRCAHGRRRIGGDFARSRSKRGGSASSFHSAPAPGRGGGSCVAPQSHDQNAPLTTPSASASLV